MTIPGGKRESFRRWRRSRPFWGGLLLMIAGIELFLSGNLDLGNLQIHLGLTGYLSYVLPLILILCGALAWASSGQRMFYGIIGILTAIYSTISVNFGGFFIGMLIGIIGGALTAAWVPDKRVPHPAEATGPTTDDDEHYGFDDLAGDDDEAEEDTADIESDGVPADERSGPLRDTLPTSTRSPLAEPEVEAEAAEQEGEQRPRFPRHAADERSSTSDADRSMIRAPLPRRSFRTIAFTLAALTIGAVGFVALRDPTPALAGDCAPTALTKLLEKAPHHREQRRPEKHTTKNNKQIRTTSGYASAPLADVPGADASDSPAPPDPTPSTPATPDPTPSVPDPTPSATSPATPSTKPTAKPTARPTATPTVPKPKPSGSCTVISKLLDVASGQPYVNRNPSTQTAATLSMSGLSYDGIVDLPTKTGTIAALQFSMDSSTSASFELRPAVDGHTISLKSSKLTVSGHVRFYTTEIKGNLLGVLPVDFTVASPPPLVVPDLFFTDATVSLVFVTCDTLTADNLSITLP